MDLKKLLEFAGVDTSKLKHKKMLAEIEQQMHIIVRYCENYNGCYLIDAATKEYLDTPQADQCIDAICDYAVDFCDEDGYFEGDDGALERFAINAVHQAFGPDVAVTVEFDTVSS